MNLDPLHMILSAAATLMTILFSIVTWFVVRLIGGIERRLDLHDEHHSDATTRLTVLETRCEGRHP